MKPGDFVLVVDGPHRGMAGRIRCRRPDGRFTVNIFARSGVPLSPALHARELRHADKKGDRPETRARQVSNGAVR